MSSVQQIGQGLSKSLPRPELQTSNNLDKINLETIENATPILKEILKNSYENSELKLIKQKVICQIKKIKNDYCGFFNYIKTIPLISLVFRKFVSERIRNLKLKDELRNIEKNIDLHLTHQVFNQSNPNQENGSSPKTPKTTPSTPTAPPAPNAFPAPPAPNAPPAPPAPGVPGAPGAPPAPGLNNKVEKPIKKFNEEPFPPVGVELASRGEIVDLTLEQQQTQIKAIDKYVKDFKQCLSPIKDLIEEEEKLIAKIRENIPFVCDAMSEIRNLIDMLKCINTDQKVVIFKYRDKNGELEIPFLSEARWLELNKELVKNGGKELDEKFKKTTIKADIERTIKSKLEENTTYLTKKDFYKNGKRLTELQEMKFKITVINKENGIEKTEKEIIDFNTAKELHEEKSKVVALWERNRYLRNQIILGLEKASKKNAAEKATENKAKENRQPADKSPAKKSDLQEILQEKPELLVHFELPLFAAISSHAGIIGMLKVKNNQLVEKLKTEENNSKKSKPQEEQSPLEIELDKLKEIIKDLKERTKEKKTQ